MRSMTSWNQIKIIRKKLIDPVFHEPDVNHTIKSFLFDGSKIQFHALGSIQRDHRAIHTIWWVISDHECHYQHTWNNFEISSSIHDHNTSIIIEFYGLVYSQVLSIFLFLCNITFHWWSIQVMSIPDTAKFTEDL